MEFIDSKELTKIMHAKKIPRIMALEILKNRPPIHPTCRCFLEAAIDKCRDTCKKIMEES